MAGSRTIRHTTPGPVSTGRGPNGLFQRAGRACWYRGAAFGLALILIAARSAQPAEAPEAGFVLARLQYGGGGDWYANPSSLPNLLAFAREQTTMAVAPQEARVAVMDEELFSYPALYMTGHGNVAFTPEEVVRLRQYLEGGGFLHADDNYGMDQSLRRELARLFPDKRLVELPPDHGLFHCHFDFPQGLPKIHEHDGKPAQALALFEGERLMVLYTYECDLGDGWEDEQIHGDPPEKRLAALRMGVNVLVWAFTH
ncbi:MAG: DUF4159 domain-containing protein [Candidatus Latescibacterota bacterium]